MDLVVYGWSKLDKIILTIEKTDEKTDLGYYDYIFFSVVLQLK